MKPIQDYQIIQRNAEGFAAVPFAGHWEPGFTQTQIVVLRIRREDDNVVVRSWTPCETSGQDWHVTVEVPAGGLYRAEAVVIEKDSLGGKGFEWALLVGEVEHFGVGEVFAVFGQSNMAGFGRGTAYDPPELGVHMLANHGRWKIASHPINAQSGGEYLNADGNSGTSALLSFGRMMKRRLNLPIGFQLEPRGGVPLSFFHPEMDGRLYREYLTKFEENGPVAGILWYQGCTDANDRDNGWAENYYRNFCRMTELWRRDLGSVPVVMAQLNKWAANPAGDPEMDRGWGLVREAQRQAARNLPGVYLVPTLDLPMSDGIHNGSASNVVIGERMATALLCGHYGQPGYLAPNVRQVKKISDCEVLLTFDGGGAGFDMRTVDEVYARGLELEDEEGLIPCVRVRGSGDDVIVTASRPFGKNAVFHAYWRTDSVGFMIYDINGMPMLSCYGVPVEA